MDNLELGQGTMVRDQQLNLIEPSIACLCVLNSEAETCQETVEVANFNDHLSLIGCSMLVIIDVDDDFPDNCRTGMILAVRESGSMNRVFCWDDSGQRRGAANACQGKSRMCQATHYVRRCEDD